MKISAFFVLIAFLISLLVSCARNINGDSAKSSGSSDMLTEAEKESSEKSTSAEAEVNGYTVCIDAGHQKSGISDKEPIGPGSSVMKAKLSAGTSGAATRIPEHVLNLEVSIMLKEELVLRGYKVIMIRETDDCPKSNAERAVIANESGADIFVRIHANGAADQTVSGVLTCAPSTANEFLSKDLVVKCGRLSKIIVDALSDSTGAQNRGVYSTDKMTGINWCKIPVTIVEMGYMSNPDEDRLMATEEYRRKIAEGIADGIDTYFG